MATMKTASTLMSLISIVVMLVYGWLLLGFIGASESLWAAWIISIAISTTTAILTIWARDEYFKAEFERITRV